MAFTNSMADVAFAIKQGWDFYRLTGSTSTAGVMLGFTINSTLAGIAIGPNSDIDRVYLQYPSGTFNISPGAPFLSPVTGLLTFLGSDANNPELIGAPAIATLPGVACLFVPLVSNFTTTSPVMITSITYDIILYTKPPTQVGVKRASKKSQRAPSFTALGGEVAVNWAHYGSRKQGCVGLHLKADAGANVDYKVIAISNYTYGTQAATAQNTLTSGTIVPGSAGVRYNIPDGTEADMIVVTGQSASDIAADKLRTMITITD